MKKLIIAALLVAGMSTYAQEKKELSTKPKMERISPEQRQERQLEKMTSELSLDTKQKQQINQILTEQSAKRKQMMNNVKATKQEMKIKRAESKKRMQEERLLMEGKMKAILSPEQFDTWKTNQEKKREKTESRMKERMDKKMKGEMKN